MNESSVALCSTYKHLQLPAYTKHGYILYMYIYLILTTKLYIKRDLKTLENTRIKSVINLTSYKIFFEKIHICNILVC